MIDFKTRGWIYCFGLWLGLAMYVPVEAQVNSMQSKTNTQEPFSGQLWNYLLSNNYKHWSPASGNQTDFYVSPHRPISSGENPNHQTLTVHKRWSKSYVNRKVNSNEDNLPIGSIVILENYHDDKSLASISVMYKSKGFDPSAKNWFWVEYNPDGSVATAPQPTDTITGKSGVDADGIPQTLAAKTIAQPLKLQGRVSSCVQCHQQATGGDMVFFNDIVNSKQR